MKNLLRAAAVVATVLMALSIWDWYLRRAPEGTRWLAVGKVKRVVAGPSSRSAVDALRIGETRWLVVEHGYVRFVEGEEAVIAERPDGYRQLCKATHKTCAFILRECARAFVEDRPANCQAQALPAGREFFAAWLAPFVPRM